MITRKKRRNGVIVCTTLAIAYVCMLLRYKTYEGPTEVYEVKRELSPVQVPPTCGMVFVLGLKTPKIKEYTERWSTLGGRGPYITELIRALESANKTQKLKLAVITDEPEEDLKKVAPEIFEYAHVITANLSVAAHGWGEKIVAYKHTPFDITLAYDTDVTFCADMSHVCSFLEHYDLAMVREPPVKLRWYDKADVDPSKWSSPDNTKSLNKLNFHNSGFLLYKLSMSTVSLFEDWGRLHNELGGGNQNPLSRLLAKHQGVRHLLLPIEYNLRAHSGIGPLTVQGNVYAIHSRTGCVTCDKVNNHQRTRIIVPSFHIGDISCSVVVLQEGKGFVVADLMSERREFPQLVDSELSRRLPPADDNH
jgi:hypothetical protein